MKKPKVSGLISKTMNILILTSSNPYINAGVIAHNLFTQLKEKGHFTKMIVREYADYKEDEIVNIQTRSDIFWYKIKNRTRKILKIKKNYNFLDNNYLIHDYDQTKQYFKTKEVLKHIDFKPDVIFYLFPQWYLNVKNLYELNKITGAPIYWYLMDRSALTGGCHYFWDCNKYLTGCSACPGMNSAITNDQSFINFNFKKTFISKTDIRIITATENDLQIAKKSLLFRDKPIDKVMLPVDDKMFKPAISKKVVRKSLNLPENKIVFFIGATYLFEKRKGMSYLIEALKKIKGQKKGRNILLLVAGNGFDSIENDLPFEYKYLGHYKNNKQLAKAYQASDFFICPSIEDAGPFMINQSIMSGTPVISFKMGVANDLVIPKKTGFLVDLKNVDKLAQCIIDLLLLNKTEIQEMSDNCRNLGLEKLSQNTFLKEFESIILSKIKRK